MKTKSSVLKANARENLLGHYPTLILTFLFVSLITYIIELPFSNMILEGLYFQVYSRLLMGFAGNVLTSLLSILFSTGLLHMHLKIYHQQQIHLSDVFYGFKNRPDRILGYGLIMFVIQSVCTLPGSFCMYQAAPELFLASDISTITSFFESADMVSVSLALLAGSGLSLFGSLIVLFFTFCFSQSLYILIEDQEISAIHAMEQSMRLMKGNKWRLLKLYLSFIGLMILSVFTLFIAILWIEPYLSQSLTCFYKDLTRRDSETESL